MRILRCLSILVLVAFTTLICGCGGGGGGEAPMTNIKADITWAERGRSIAAPASALSCRISLYQPVTTALGNGTAENPAHTWILNRSTSPGGYTQNWVSPDKVSTQKWRVEVTFTSEGSGAGSIVGIANFLADIRDDGSGIGGVAVDNVITRLEVLSGQSLLVGERRRLLFTAHDMQGNTVAITPGSVRWDVGTATMTTASAMPHLEILRFDAGEAVGMNPGTIPVRILMDNIASPNVPVVVKPVPPRISVVNCTVWRNEVAGNWIYFAGGVGDKLDIYKIKPDGSLLDKYTSIGADIISFDITSDYQTIVYEQRVAGMGSGSKLMRINADGTNPTELSGINSGHPVIMYDSSVLFDKSSSVGADRNLYTVSISGGAITHIPNNTPSEEQPNWIQAIPGRPALIVYLETRNGAGLIWTKSLDNSIIQPLVGDMESGHVVINPCFGADANSIIAANSLRTNSADHLEIGILDVPSKRLSYPFPSARFGTVYGISRGPNGRYCFIGETNGVRSLYTASQYSTSVVKVFELDPVP